uniref:RHDF1 protein n=1 Tax=Buteo japonicus TaxID=224669 RepID=A0A8C0BG15_9AVES
MLAPVFWQPLSGADLVENILPFTCKELADESCELNGHQDLLFTPLVSSDSPLRPEDKRGTMSEARHDSTSSLQRKKPPWLKLDIPVPVPVSVPEEPQPVQPTRRQAFLRSVSMPADNTRVPSLPNEVRRPVLQRQTSITQTIKR